MRARVRPSHVCRFDPTPVLDRIPRARNIATHDSRAFARDVVTRRSKVGDDMPVIEALFLGNGD